MCFLEINFTLFAVVYDATNYMSMKMFFINLENVDLYIADIANVDNGLIQNIFYLH